MSILVKVSQDPQTKDLINDFYKFCDKYGMRKSINEFSDFVKYFDHNKIMINTMRSEESYRNHIIDLVAGEEFDAIYFQDREEAEKEVVYQGFRLLYDRQNK